MAGKSRTIRVSGLPVDRSENRLIDKLQIHFLRKKNGGGEISSVTVSKMVPGTAFITFEESKVASRLAQRGKQVFKVNDKTYDITIRLYQEEVDVDNVLLSMSVVVDHTKLPGGKDILLAFHESFPGVRLVYDDQKDVYTLEGRYSEVQSLSSLVLGSLEKQTDSKKTYNLPLEESANSHMKVDSGVVKHTALSDDLDQDLETEGWKTGLPLASNYSDQASHLALMEDKWDPAPDTGTSFEDFSLIVDSDIFRYLHTYCSKQYESILRRHRVEVLDVNCDDITTLYLKPKTARSEQDMSSVKKAHLDLAHLYHQIESQLRKEHVYKRGIPEKELAHALESLRKRLPRLMIDEEDMNVYMVGSKSEVSEAKQFLADMRGFGMENKIHSSDHLFGSSQPKFTFSKQGSSASSEPSGSLKDSDDLFMPKKDLNKGISSENSSRRRHKSVELKHFDDHSPTGQLTFPSQKIESSTKDIFSLRRSEVSQERHVPGDLKWKEPCSWLDRNKCTDSLFDSSKPSLSAPNLKSDFNSEPTELQSHSDTRANSSEIQIKSGKVYKTKQTEQTGKERKMAANFSREMHSEKSVTPKLDEDAYINERKFPGSGQPHSLPIIKPSMNSNLDPNVLSGGSSAKTSISKTDIQDLKGGHFLFDKKPTVTPSCLSGDQDVKCSSTIPSGSTLRRSNSFSSSIKKGEETPQMAVDVSAGPKGTSQNSQTREIFAMDLVLSFRLWLYLTSVYKTEIENLTTDIQVKEKNVKEGMMLCIRSIDSEKVSECHHGLKSLIAKAAVDFDSRTLPLSKIGVVDNKDEILLEFCAFMKQRYKMIKILVMSNDMMIIGPKPQCDEVEATVIKVFNKEGSTENSKAENEKSPNPDSSHTITAPDSDLLRNQLATPHIDIIMKDLSKTSDQSVPHSSKKTPQVLTDQTRDNQEQDDESKNQNEVNEEMLECLDKKDPTLVQGNGGTINTNSGETSSGSVINSATKDKADGENNKDYTSTSAESKDTFTGQTNPGISLDQSRDSQGSPEEPKIVHQTLLSHASGKLNLLLCYVCEKEYSSVKQAACGFNFCLKCDKEVHNNCRICSNVGIKGTMSVHESTITLLGFPKDTTLRIVYDIPNGIQGEDHPCPGAPFKGNRFEAFLPHNKTTKKLLPLLKKAFYKGLTFTVKVGSLDNDGSTEGRVVWGSIPHKTRTEGGASKNAYPDFNYIKRLDEALKAAGVGE